MMMSVFIFTNVIMCLSVFDRNNASSSVLKAGGQWLEPRVNPNETDFFKFTLKRFTNQLSRQSHDVDYGDNKVA